MTPPVPSTKMNTKNSKKKKGFFHKKTVEVAVPQDEDVIDFNEESSTASLDKGTFTKKDLIAPPAFYRGEVKEGDWMKVGNLYERSFVMQGFPSTVQVGWLDELYNYEGDMDVTLHIQPADDREALDSLTSKIVQFESQLSIESEKGNIRNLTKLRSDIDNLYAQRSKLEQNQENLFYLQIAANLYAPSMESLDKQTQKLDNKLKGRKIYMMPTYLRQADGYKSALPFGRTYLPDKFRNFNTGALLTTFPFYHSDIMHESGVFIGQNYVTGTPILIDFYDKSKLNNSNITVFGKAGSGKTFFVSLLTMRSAGRGVRTVIIDPEGEYYPVTKSLGGSHIYIAPGSDSFINPFDIESEQHLNEDGSTTETVDVKAKVADVLNLIEVMSGGMTAEERSLVSMTIRRVYNNKGITENPDSLRVSESYYDSDSDIFYQEGKMKPMPTFSDFHGELEKVAVQEQNESLKRLATSLRMFKKGEVYELFDTQTSENLRNFKDAPIVTFDISRLDENILRPVGMYVALQWTWEKFVKKNPKIQKRVVCDEAWMLVNPNMAGHEMTAQFLENCARRIRKRNGGLLVASQNFREFDSSEQGRAVLTNATVNIFLQQDPVDISSLKDRFNLSDGESSFLLRAQRGEMLIRIKQESAVAQVVAFEAEKILIDKAKEYIGGIGHS